MFWEVRELAAEGDHLDLIPEPHMVEEENRFV